jgi:hypothetical protein
MENRHGLVTEVEVLPAYGTAERDAALVMMEAIPGDQRATVGADKGYDTQAFVAEARHLKVTPHVAQNNKRRKRAMEAPRGMVGMPSASRSASGSKRSLAG